MFKKQSSRQKELNQAVSAAEAALRDALQQSPASVKAFEAYQLAVGEQHSAVTEQAFESGYRSGSDPIGGPTPHSNYEPDAKRLISGKDADADDTDSPWEEDDDD